MTTPINIKVISQPRIWTVSSAMAYVLKGCLLAYSFLSDLNPFTMPRHRDAFENLFDPSLSSSIGFFVASFFRFSAPEKNRLYFLRQRFMVTLIGINKAGSIFQHESFAVWVYDVVKDKKHTFIIERTPSKQSRSVIFSSFSGSPDSQTVLDSINQAIEGLRSGGSLDSSVTQLPDDSDSDSESIPLTNPSLESSVPTPPTTSQTNDRLPLVDAFTSSLARAGGALNAGSQSSSSANFAQDKILWAASLDPKQCIKRFEPQGLPFFDLVVLADVVHEQAPIYCLFQRHCYWFANVIFMAIVMLYTLPPSASTVLPSPSASTSASSITAPAIPVPAPTLAVDTPKDANLLVLPENPQAGRAGRWLGLLINDPGVLHTVVTIVTKKFATRLRGYIHEVILHD